MAKKPNLKVVLTAALPGSIEAAPPSHLGRDGRDLWHAIMGAYDVRDPGGLALLRQAAEAIDRIARVRRQIDEQGELLVIKGIPRVHPLCAVERDQRAAFTRCIRALNLDVEPLRDAPGRPPGR